MKKSKTNTVGVIVGRFQASVLHKGHLSVINRVRRKHRHVLIIIGSTHAFLDSNNPLDYETRKVMIQKIYPTVRIAELKDCRHDDVWSKKLDNVIANEFPGKEAILYGSRKSFIPRYSGIHRTVLLKEIKGYSATKIRNQINIEPLSTQQFRSGMIYASIQTPPLLYQTVDTAVINYDEKLILLGKKKEEHGKLRFIGGFVQKTDLDLELAAKREVIEETSFIEVDEFKYLGSFRVNDWRYRGTKNGIMTAFFAAQYIFGHAAASDDLDDVQWVPYDKFFGKLVKEHKPLGKALMNHLKRNKSKKGL